jgi:hypothetical protein
VNSQCIAAFPMYDFPELESAHDELWSAIRTHLIEAGLVETPVRLRRGTDHVAVWTHPSLILGQGCEYPLAKFFADRVRLVEPHDMQFRDATVPLIEAPSWCGRTIQPKLWRTCEIGAARSTSAYPIVG